MPALFAALAVTAVAASATPAPPPPAKLTKWQEAERERFKNSAPADEYFGRLKMSFLGMNNTFRDSSISSGDHTTNQGIINKVALAEDALDDWAAQASRTTRNSRARISWRCKSTARSGSRQIRIAPGSTSIALCKRSPAATLVKRSSAISRSASPNATTRFPSHAQRPLQQRCRIQAPTRPRRRPPRPPRPVRIQTSIAKGLRAQILPQS